jgi:crotonobetainyl-CoA:carnitine CoA-transferase CaiB-like acyl-CoA transferase
MTPRLALAQGTGKTSRSDLLRGGAYDVYRTKDGRFLTLGIIEDKFWESLSRAIGMEELASDARFKTDGLRSEHRQEVRKILEPVLAQRDLEVWLELFQEADVPAAPVNRLDEVERDPQMQARKLFFDLTDHRGRSCKQVGYPAHFKVQAGSKDRSAPAMGCDTRRILHDLGWSEEEIKRLEREGVVNG